MNLQANKTDGKVLPLSNRRIAAQEWNQLAASCMAFITAAGFTPDALDNDQFLNAFKAIAADLELVGANTNLSNLTAVGESKFTAKADTDLSNVPANIDYVVERGGSGLNTWEIYKSGWCVQRGQVLNIAANQFIEVQFLKPFANTNYILIGNGVDPSAFQIPDTVFGCKNLTASSFYGGIRYFTNASAYADRGFQWEAKGFINQQEEV